MSPFRPFRRSHVAPRPRRDPTATDHARRRAFDRFYDDAFDRVYGNLTRVLGRGEPARRSTERVMRKLAERWLHDGSSEELDAFARRCVIDEIRKAVADRRVARAAVEVEDG